MPTYLYETIPTTGGKARRFEHRQAFSEPALTVDPESGEPVQRVISGGLGIITRDAGRSSSDEPAGPGCGPDSCTCGRYD